MIDYKKSMKILELHYAACVRFWKMQDEQIAEVKALRELMDVKHNPFSPTVQFIDQQAKADLVDRLTREILL